MINKIKLLENQLKEEDLKFQLQLKDKENIELKYQLELLAKENMYIKGELEFMTKINELQNK